MDLGCCESSGFVVSASRDLIPIIAALEYNQWFSKLSSKDLRLVSGDEAPGAARLGFKHLPMVRKVDVFLPSWRAAYTCISWGAFPQKCSV